MVLSASRLALDVARFIRAEYGGFVGLRHLPQHGGAACGARFDGAGYTELSGPDLEVGQAAAPGARRDADVFVGDGQAKSKLRNDSRPGPPRVRPRVVAQFHFSSTAGHLSTVSLEWHRGWARLCTRCRPVRGRSPPAPQCAAGEAWWEKPAPAMIFGADACAEISVLGHGVLWKSRCGVCRTDHFDVWWYSRCRRPDRQVSHCRSGRGYSRSCVAAMVTAGRGVA
jgi:hypothetical protein